MTNNGWIVCVIGIILLLCVCLFCFLLSLLGVGGIFYVSPTLSMNLPYQSYGIGSPTPSPIVIRPTFQGLETTPPPFYSVTTPESDPPAPVTIITPLPLSVPTDTLFTLENTIIPINDPIEITN